MFYLSQFLNKNLFYKDQAFGKIVDFCVEQKENLTLISTFVVKKEGKKILIPASLIKLNNGKIYLTKKNPKVEFFSEKEFCLVEDVLDKQVIDVTGRRLVRVNDILLKENGGMQVVGIDIGVTGILRRLGFGFFFGFRNISIPWSLIEAFDYQTGNIKIKLTESRLNNFHPAEIADILEEAGAKERRGLVESLDAQKAAYALEEADVETQQSILEELSETELDTIINKMHVSEIADILHKMNPFTVKNIMKSLGTEKAHKVKTLSVFADDVAGGLMSLSTHQLKEEETVEKVVAHLKAHKSIPEVNIVVDKDKKLKGVVLTKALMNKDSKAKMKEIMKEPRFVREDTSFTEIMRLFSEYNLRLLPVVDRDMKVVGAIPVDAIIAQIQEAEEEENEL